MSVPATLKGLTDDGLSRLELAGEVDPQASDDVKARLREHIEAERTQRQTGVR